MSTTTTTRTTRKRAPKPAPPQPPAPKKAKNNPNKSSSKGLALRTGPPSIGRALLAEYVNTLKDPFEYGPMKLGYDCFVNSCLATAYRRGALTVNADGSFGLLLIPSCTNMVVTNNAGAAVATWTTSSAQNIAAISNQMSEARIVSYGLRLFVAMAETAQPGVLYTGTDVNNSYTSFTALPPATIATLSGSEMCLGTRGARAVGFPIDNTSYSFWTAITNGFAGGSLPYSPTLYASGLGFPVGSIVYYEAIINLEGLPVDNVIGLGINPNVISKDSLVDYFPSVDSLYNAAKSYLVDAVTPDAVIGLASTVGAAAISRRFPGIGRTMSAFGGGSALRAARSAADLVAGRNVRRQSSEFTRTIREMKEDFP